MKLSSMWLFGLSIWALSLIAVGILMHDVLIPTLIGISCAGLTIMIENDPGRKTNG